MDANVSALSMEVVRLKDELNAATFQRCQAAEQGLILLAQKEQLQQQLDETEGRLDCFRQELELSRKALNDLNCASRRQSRVDFEDEQDLLTLSVTREMEMSQQIHELEIELKNLRSAYDNLVAENDKLSASLHHLQTNLRQSESNRQDLRSELSQLKKRENQSLVDYADLEEENISLQKQLLHMKQAQVEFEALKHEMKRYEEETEILNAQLDEMTRLRTMAQRSLDGTLESLQIEREKVHSLQRQLDYRSVNVYQTTNPALVRGMLDSGVDEEDESGCFSEAQNDLLSEIQSSEQRKFETTVTSLETEKADLRQQLEDSQNSLQMARREIHLKKEEIEALQSQIDVIMSIENEATEDPGDGETEEEERLRRAVKSQEHKYVIALKQISSLQQELRRCHEWEQLGRQFGSEDELRKEVVRLRSRVAQRDDAIHTLESDLVLINAMNCRTSSSLSSVHADLHSAANELMRVYIRAGKACGQEVPAKYVVEHLGHCKLHFNNDGQPSVATEAESDAKDGRDLVDVGRMAEALFYLVKHTSTAVVGLVQQQEQSGDQLNGPMTQGKVKDATELQQQITRLKSMLCNKREQVATLRNVLRANKKTAEEALANLKTRYEHEKGRASDTMSKLRSELKAHREEAATFTSLRALYAQKCDEYVTQLDELQRRHQIASDERNTFRSLLSISLAQKADLSKRMDDLEKSLITTGKSKRRQNGAD